MSDYDCGFDAGKDYGYEDGLRDGEANGYADGYADAKEELSPSDDSNYARICKQLWEVFYDLEEWPYPHDEMAYDRLNAIFLEHLNKRHTKNDRF
jgi:hypothetical protein